MATKKKTKTKSKKTSVILALALIIVAVGVAGFIWINGQDGNADIASVVPEEKNTAEVPQSSQAAIPESEGITIDKNAVTEEAAFYPYQFGDTYMEVIAIRASDGTVRTAFNTCQVCFDSGRGYYKQDGDVLVCQNCGNRFTIDQIEVIKGGCNPVPIFKEDKTETDDQVIITDEVMADYSELFSKWTR
jgi:hypothetical protein